MPDRHSELLRQRALVLEHLAWLEREIAASGSAAPPPGVLPPNAPAPATVPAASNAATVGNAAVAPSAPATTPEKSADEIPAETEVILEQYRVPPAALKDDVRKGCLLYFIGAFVVLGIVIAILYFTIGTH